MLVVCGEDTRAGQYLIAHQARQSHQRLVIVRSMTAARSPGHGIRTARLQGPHEFARLTVGMVDLGGCHRRRHRQKRVKSDGIKSFGRCGCIQHQ